MNRYGLQIFVILALFVLFIVDKAWQGVFGFFDYISLTALLLVTLANLNIKNSFIVPFMVLGLIADWYNKSFIGAGSVTSILSLYVFNIFRIRFINNKAALTGLNFFFFLILLFMINGYDNVLNLNYVIGAFISTILISPVWLKE